MDEQYRVDIGGEHLDVAGAVRVASRDRARPFEHGLDERGVRVLRRKHGHPIADSRQIRRGRGRLEQAGRELRADDPAGCRHQDAAAVAPDHAPWREALGGVGFEERLPARGIAEGQ